MSSTQVIEKECDEEMWVRVGRQRKNRSSFLNICLAETEKTKFFTSYASPNNINTKTEQNRKYKSLSTNRALLVSFVALASMSVSEGSEKSSGIFEVNEGQE